MGPQLNTSVPTRLPGGKNTTAEKLLDSDRAWFWSDKLERQVLRDEATKLIRGK